jgi:hypothetical protein
MDAELAKPFRQWLVSAKLLTEGDALFKKGSWKGAFYLWPVGIDCALQEDPPAELRECVCVRKLASDISKAQESKEGSPAEEESDVGIVDVCLVGRMGRCCLSLAGFS